MTVDMVLLLEKKRGERERERGGRDGKEKRIIVKVVV